MAAILCICETDSGPIIIRLPAETRPLMMLLTEPLTTTDVADDRSVLASQAPSVEDWTKPELERSWTETYPASDIPSHETNVPKEVSYSAPINRQRRMTPSPPSQIKVLQQWECVIHEISGDCVSCELHDLTDSTCPTEFAEIYISEFSEFDRPLLEEGAVFYWSVGRETSKTGQVRRYSELRMRRMPPLSRSKRREIARKAQQLGQLLTNTCR